MSYLATFSNIVHCGTSHNAKLIEQTGKATGDAYLFWLSQQRAMY
jgi:hypothetical protein